MDNIAFGVIKISTESLLEKLINSKKIDEKSHKEVIISPKNKYVYLWAIMDRWPPIHSGIADSKTEIAHIAHQHGLDQNIDFSHRTYPNCLLRDNTMRYKDYPIFSFIKRQSGLYFACAWGNNLQFLCDIEPIIKIDNITRNEVLELSDLWGRINIDAQSWNSKFINTYIRRQEAKRIFVAPAKINPNPIFVEFLYSPESTWYIPRKRWVWQRYRIVKKTAKTIFIEEHPYQGTSYLKTGWQAFIVYTVMMNRTILEAEHEFFHKSRNKTFYEKCAVPELKNKRFIDYESIQSESTDYEWDTDDVIEIPKNSIQWATTLLHIREWPATKDAIKNAFNLLSIKTHPDKTGGSHHEFILIKRARDFLIDSLKQNDGD